jgi:hypothetical protein
MSAIFLKERVRVYRWSAVIVGFGGERGGPRTIFGTQR